MEKKYVLVKDLMENGARECKVLYQKPNVRNCGSRYILIIEDESACTGRGEVCIYYGKELILSHFIFPHENSTGLNAFERYLTIGDLKKCIEWLEKNNIRV